MMRRPQWPKWVGNGSPRFRRALATDELPRSARNGHCERTPKTGIQFSGTIDVPDCRAPVPPPEAVTEAVPHPVVLQLAWTTTRRRGYAR
jgi:hypothetical protein